MADIRQASLLFPMMVNAVMIVVSMAAMIVNTARIPMKRHPDIGSADGVSVDLPYINLIALNAQLLYLFRNSSRIEAKINQRPDAHIAADSRKSSQSTEFFPYISPIKQSIEELSLIISS
jgi:hypothetical protein